LSAHPTRRAPFAQHGFIIANEVLDCLAHHKIVATPTGPGVVFVTPPLTTDARTHGKTSARTYVEHVLPLSAVAELRPFLELHCAEVLVRRTFPPYFACPAIATLMINTARLYARCEAFWIDYGEERRFHLRTPAQKRIFAGPPKSGASVYDHPGHDDITFMVDFTVARSAARAAGQRVVSYGHQGDLARYAGVRFDGAAADLIARSRAVTWLLAVNGVGPERDWRQTGLTWTRSAARGGSVASGIHRSIDEFLGRRRSPFKLLVLRN
jgi:SAM-dependent MidA family methyltransferase